MLKSKRDTGRMVPLTGLFLLLAIFSLIPTRAAGLMVPSVFGDHMVFQRGQTNSVWGWADAGKPVRVRLGDEVHETVAGADGFWKVALAPRMSGGALELEIGSGLEKRTFADVVFGEVWLCSGQSNMLFPVSQSLDGGRIVAEPANPNIRFLRSGRRTSTDYQRDLPARWETSRPESRGLFSGVGYHFASAISQTLDVPVGILQIAVGGSTIEAWIDRRILQQDTRFSSLMKRWAALESVPWNEKPEQERHAAEMAAWEAARLAGQDLPRKPRAAQDPRESRGRPGTFYAGLLHSVVGFGIRGVLWYQGESNAEGHKEYAELFPLLIQSWREAWGQGDFPFLWVQLPNHGKPSLMQDGGRTKIREAQAAALSLPATGQIVTIDLGDPDDIHPLNKTEVGRRLAALALADVYDVSPEPAAPRLGKFSVSDHKMVLEILRCGKGLQVRSKNGPSGFLVAGEDKVFHPAQARVVEPDGLEVWSDAVAKPAAVRYAWAGSPPVTVFSSEDLPLAPFRTDTWEQSSFQPTEGAP